MWDGGLVVGIGVPVDVEATSSAGHSQQAHCISIVIVPRSPRELRGI